MSVLDGIALSLRFSRDRKRGKTKQIAFQTREPRFPSEVKSVTATLHYQPSQNPSANLYNQQQPRTIKSQQQLSTITIERTIKNSPLPTITESISKSLQPTITESISNSTQPTNTKSQQEPNKSQQEHLRKNAVGSPV